MSALTNPKAIIFDLLTALLDSWSLWSAAAGDEATGRLWRERYLEVTFGCGKYRKYDELIEESARNIEGLSRDAPSKLLNSWSKLQPWSDSKATLERLKERGYFIAIVTNCSRERGYIAISRCGVQFDAVITAEESGYYKPHPKAYLAILEKLGIANPADALFVAGSNRDVVGAAAVGMGTVWHNRVGLPMLPGSAPYVVGRSLRKTLQSLLGYAGLERSEISTPTLYMNRRKFVANCQRMQARAKSLDALFRVHIKTHKTREGTLEQVRGGEGHIVVSSLKEIEWMEPLVKTGAISTVCVFIFF
jgi:2-haloacid dehalogenase